MRQEFFERLNYLQKEKMFGSWKDGWVYGRLNQEFELQLDELNAMSTALGFKYGWNAAVKDILENQWQEEEVRWMQQELGKVQRKVSSNRQKERISQKIAALLQELETTNQSERKLTDIERVLIALILKMRADEQLWILEEIFNRYRF